MSMTIGKGTVQRLRDKQKEQIMAGYKEQP